MYSGRRQPCRESEERERLRVEQVGRRFDLRCVPHRLV